MYQSIFTGIGLGAGGGVVLAIAVLVPGGEVAALIAASYWLLVCPALAHAAPVAEALARSKTLIGELEAAPGALIPTRERRHA